MAFVIFGDSFTFPDGNAATNRVHTYAKGFYENGVNVHVICFRNEYISDGDNVMNGIHYYHPFNQKQRTRNFILRRWLKFIKYFNTLKLIKRINENDTIIGINCWTQRLIPLIYIYCIII